MAEALAVWRETRDPDIADAIDRMPAPRIARDEPFGPWWMARARQPYDPGVAGALLEYVSVGLRTSEPRWLDVRARWPTSPLVAIVGDSAWGSSTTWLDRAAALLAWPDDPRVARVLASWLTGPAIFVAAPLRARVAAAIADRLVAIGDVRVRPRMAAYLAHVASAPERPAVERVLAALDAMAPVHAAVGLEVEPDPLEALWRRAAEDLEARSVLGDALVALGDERGTFIALDTARTRRAAKQARRLLQRYWERWAGPDLVSLAVRDGLVFERGVLVELAAGHAFTPPWAWTAVARHRELAAVHTVRTAVIKSDAAYARFLTALPRLRVLEIDHHAMLDACARLPIVRLEIRRARPRATFELLRIIDRARAIAPNLVEIAIASSLPDAEIAIARSPTLVHVLPRAA